MSEDTLELARRNMIEQQIRTWEVLDERLLALIGAVPREDFVPPAYRALAFGDMSIPLGRDEVMLPPKLEARLLQALAVEPGDKVLEVGTGSGYVTALLARLGAHVHSVEIVPEFKLSAATRLGAHGFTNVTLEVGDAARGWARHAPYDAILLTGSVPILPEDFKRSLAAGGRLVAVVGQAPVMEARRVARVGDQSFEERCLFETCVPPLRNAVQPPAFVF